MRPLLFSFLLLSFALALPRLRASDRIDFWNGDRIHGRWLATDDSSIRFRPYGSDQDIVLQTEAVRAIYASGPGEPPPQGNHVVLRLHDGSTISGTAFSAKDGVFQWTALWGQVLQLRAAAVAGITFIHREELLFSGPGNPEDWLDPHRDRHITPPVREAGGLLIFPSNLGLKTRKWDLDTPDRFRLDVQYSCVLSKHKTLQMSLFGKRGASTLSFPVFINVDAENIRLQWPREDGQRGLEMQNHPMKVEDHLNAHFTFFVNIPASEIHVFFNKKPLTTLRGSWIQHLKNSKSLSVDLISGNMAPDIVLKQVQGLVWNGVLPSESPRAPNADECRVTLRDGSVHLLKTASLGAVALTLETPNLPPRSLPYADLRDISFPPPLLPEPPASSVRVFAGAPGDMFVQVPKNAAASASPWITPPSPPAQWTRLVLRSEAPSEAASEATPAQSGIRLLNGDRVSLAASRMDKGLLLARPPWLSPTAPDLRLPLQWVGTWFNTPSAISENQAAHLLVELANGDVITGRLLSLDPEQLQIQCPWQQASTLDLSFIHRLTFHQKNERILDRIGDSKDWSSGGTDRENNIPPTLTGLGATFVSAGGTGRRLAHLPPRFSLDVTLRPQSPQYSITLALSTGLRHQHNPSMAFTIGPQQLYYSLSRSRAPPLQTWHTSLYQPGPLRAQPQRLRLVGDNTTRVYALYIDGELVFRWEMPPDLTPPLTDYRWLVLACQYTTAPLHVESLRLDALPPGVDLDLPPPAPNHIRALFRNGDILLGDSARSENNTIHLRTPASTEFPIPIDRLYRLERSPSSSTHVRRTARDVGVVLANAANQLTLRLLSWDEQSMTFEQEGWKDPLRIPIAQLSRIRFNIHTPHRMDDTTLESMEWLNLF